MLIGDTLDDLVKGTICINDIPVISVKKEDDKWISADNRRLWIFKYLEQFGKCETIPVKEVRRIAPFKNSSKTDGLSVKIRGGGDPGGAAIPVFEQCIQDRNIEWEEHETKLQENKKKWDSLYTLYKKHITLYQNDEKDRKAEIDSLKEEKKNMQAKLSKLEETILQSQDIYENSLEKLRIRTEVLEDTVKKRETQLLDSRKNNRSWSQAYKDMVATYEEKHRQLQRIITSNTDTIDELKKEMETIKEENNTLKKEIDKKDKRMTEIRKLTYA